MHWGTDWFHKRNVYCADVTTVSCGLQHDTFHLGFDVHGSIHHGNVYVQLKVQLDVHVFICILYSSLFLALHVSGAICTHPQESEPDRAKSVRVSQPVPAPID
jgi:hypothetical protein